MALAFLTCATFAGADESCTRLADVLRQAEFHYFREEIETAALETNEKCIDVLRTGYDNSSAQRSQLADALLIIGGAQAVELLKALYLREKDSDSSSRLCSAMASTGRDSDVKFLIEFLHGPQIGIDWEPIQRAALALCLLRRQSTLQPLRAAASESPDDTIAGAAIRHAVECVKGGELKTPQAGGLTEEEEVILAVVRSRIPATESTRRFAETSVNRVWERSGSSWTFRTLCEDFFNNPFAGRRFLQGPPRVFSSNDMRERG